MKKVSKNNNAFIDSQNLHLGEKSLGWSLDFNRFRNYLREKYEVTTAYLFIGYLPGKESFYEKLESFNYIIKHKPTLMGASGKIKGNCDAELVLQSMIDISKYDKAVIVTSDGDFHSLIEYLYKENKLECLLIPTV